MRVELQFREQPADKVPGGTPLPGSADRDIPESDLHPTCWWSLQMINAIGMNLSVAMAV
jgi:hypothetical protein